VKKIVQRQSEMHKKGDEAVRDMLIDLLENANVDPRSSKGHHSKNVVVGVNDETMREASSPKTTSVIQFTLPSNTYIPISPDQLSLADFDDEEGPIKSPFRMFGPRPASFSTGAASGNGNGNGPATKVMVSEYTAQWTTKQVIRRQAATIVVQGTENSQNFSGEGGGGKARLFGEDVSNKQGQNFY